MKKKSILWEIIKSIVLSILIVFTINKWFFKPVEVVGVSMYPTLKNGERGFSSLIALKTEELRRFDIVVVNTEQHGLIVKRLIALPNETIEINDNVLYINNQEIEQDFLNQEYKASYQQSTSQLFDRDFGPITLNDNQYFVMGDNRPYSLDSRSAMGPFHASDIISKDIFIFYPLSELKYLGQ